jgi:hypothetical protein
MFQQKLRVLSRKAATTSTLVIDFEMTTQITVKPNLCMGPFSGVETKMKPFLYQKGIPARIELPLVIQGPVVLPVRVRCSECAVRVSRPRAHRDLHEPRQFK